MLRPQWLNQLFLAKNLCCSENEHSLKHHSARKLALAGNAIVDIKASARNQISCLVQDVLLGRVEERQRLVHLKRKPSQV